MRKYLTVLMLFLLFAGCRAEEKEKPELVESDTILSETSDITLAVKEDSLTDTGLILLITNETSDTFTYGYEYGLEVKQDDQWYRLKIKMAVPAIAVFLKEGPGSTEEFHVRWNKGDVSEGNYRIVKDIGKYTLAAEFVYDIPETEDSSESSSRSLSGSTVSGVYQYNPQTKEAEFIPEENFYSGSSAEKRSNSKPPKDD